MRSCLRPVGAGEFPLALMGMLKVPVPVTVAHPESMRTVQRVLRYRLRSALRALIISFVLCQSRRRTSSRFRCSFVLSVLFSSNPSSWLSPPSQAQGRLEAGHIFAASGQHRPQTGSRSLRKLDCSTGHLVGQRHRHHLESLGGQQLARPQRQRRGVLHIAQPPPHRHRSCIEKASQIPVAHLRYPPQPRLAGG